jgi:hypothetical protein
MHKFVRANDGVGGTGLQAFCAADASFFIDDRDPVGLRHAACRIEWKYFSVEQRGECGDTGVTARRAAIYWRFVGGDCLGVRHTTLVAALGTLRLRQDRIDLVGEGEHHYPICFAQSAINCGPL